MRTPSLSVIIPTYMREDVLVATIESLRAQTGVDFETIVVDQSPRHDPATETYLRGADEAGRIKWIRSARPSLPQARNVGYVHSCAPVILFIDDDVVLPPGFLAAHHQRYTDETVAAVAGRLLMPGEDQAAPCPAPLSADAAARRIDLQVIRYSTPLENPRHIPGGNFSVRRCWYRHVGGFSHRFGPPCLAEDIEFAGRLRRAGGRIVFDPAAWLLHLAAPFGGTRLHDAGDFHRARLRMTDYYFALFHGLGVSEASEAIAHRWRRDRPGALSTESIIAQSDASPKPNRFASALGRGVGAVGGTLRALRFAAEGGQLGEIPKQSGRTNPPTTMAIVIATYNRAPEVLRLVRQLDGMSHTITEVIVVDQSEEANPELDGYIQNHRMTYIRMARPNASAARNAGVAACTSEIVAFLDDDAIPEESWPEALLGPFADPEVALVGGRILFPEQSTPASPFPGNREVAQRADAPVCYHDTPFEDVLHVISCNMAVRRDWFVMVGGFHEALPGYGEDLDLVARVRRAGGRIIYEPLARVVHDQPMTGGIRRGSVRPFAFSRRRGFAHHYSMLRAVGIGGWLTVSARRNIRAFGRYIHHRNGSVGPLNSSRRAMPPALGGKIPQLFGSLVSVPTALLMYLRNGNSGGDYLRTAKWVRDKERPQ